MAGSSVLDVVSELHGLGLSARWDASDGILEIRDPGDRLSAPWRVVTDAAAVSRVLVRIASREKCGRREAVHLLATIVRADTRTYSPERGPFHLDAAGQVLPARPGEDSFGPS